MKNLPTQPCISKDFLFRRLSHEYASDRKYGSQKIPAKNPISFKQSQSIYSISDLDLWVASVLSLMAVLKNGLGWQIGSPAISYLTTAVQHCKLFENYPGIFPGDKFVVTEKLGSPLAECQDQKYTAKPKSRRKDIFWLPPAGAEAQQASAGAPYSRARAQAAAWR